MKDYLIEQNILLNCLMKIKAQFKVPLWSVIRIEIGWSWWKGVYKYLLLISSWWCDNGRCILLQEKPSSAGMHRVGRVVWGKSPLNWIFSWSWNTHIHGPTTFVVLHVHSNSSGGSYRKTVILPLYWQGWTSWTQHQCDTGTPVTLQNGCCMPYFPSLTSHVIKWYEVKG